MKNFTNQRGLAMLEVVIVAAIVAIFSTVAVPKMARILDKVQLDYEMKHLYSTLNLARSIGKNSEGGSTLEIYKDIGNYELKIGDKIFSSHNLSAQGMKLSTYSDSGAFQRISFTAGNFSLEGTTSKSRPFKSKSGRVQITSRFPKSAVRIYFDSVGRIRGEYVK